MISTKSFWTRRLGAGLFAFGVVGSWLSAQDSRPPQIIQDTLNRSLRIPDKVDRILSLQPEITRLIVALGSLPPSERRPRVYLSFWGGLTKTPVFYEPVAVAGGINVAEGLLPAFAGTLLAVVGLEQVVAWNPDIFLIQGNYPPGDRTVTVAAVRKDKRLAALDAVRGGRVYYTFGFWNWWDPAQVLVETLYLAKLFHPGLFSHVDLAREGEAIFKTFYGFDGALAALNRILRFDEWTHDRK